MTTQSMYVARFIPAVGGSAITVKIPANDHFQAKKIIEQQYGPIKSWFSSPQRAK